MSPSDPISAVSWTSKHPDSMKQFNLLLTIRRGYVPTRATVDKIQPTKHLVLTPAKKRSYEIDEGTRKCNRNILRVSKARTRTDVDLTPSQDRWLGP